MKEVTTSQFWLAPTLDPKEFCAAFEGHFLDGSKAEHIPLVPDAHPYQVEDGSHFFELTLPTARMAEYWPFILLYAERHGMRLKKFPASGFGYVHSG
jgi:hypothetical protein